VTTLSAADPYRRLILRIEFNVPPMFMSAWQVKEFGLWAAHCRAVHEAGSLLSGRVRDLERHDMIDFLVEYEDHPSGGVVLGDATGNRRDTRSPSETDWTIIRKNLSELDHFGVIPGLVKKRKSVTGRTRRGEGRITYSNPNRRETINLLNNFMIDEDGDPRILFLPGSQYESGGVAESVAGAEYDMTSKVDDSSDKSDDRSLPRTHFFDGTRYVVYFVNGKLIHPESQKLRSHMNQAEVGEKNLFAEGREVQVDLFGSYIERGWMAQG
jgi:hypothetical protein